MDIRVCSDLHLETIFRDVHVNKSTVRNIFSSIYPYEYTNISVLAGDIGDPYSDYYWNFITYVSEMSDLVLIVPGNHEYYGTFVSVPGTSTPVPGTFVPRSIVKTNQFLLEQEKKYSNVVFLIDDIVEVEFRSDSSSHILTFVGTTLWSHIPDEYASDLVKVLPVFKMIKEFSGSDGVDVFNKYNRKARELLELGCKMTNPCFITHYAPFFNLCQDVKYRDKITQYGYSNDLLNLNPLIWCYGHTHYDIDDSHIYSFVNNPTVYISNQLGSNSFQQMVRRRLKDDRNRSKKDKYAPCLVFSISLD